MSTVNVPSAPTVSIPGLSATASDLLFFGSGRDGALVANSGTTTLTGDTEYSSITLTGTAKIDCAGFKLKCSGIVDITGMPAGTIFRTVNAGTTASSSSGATGGASTLADGQTLGGNGLTGTTGGASSTTTGAQASAGTTRSFSAGGAGGASGAGGTGASGAGGASRSGTAITRAGASLLSPSMVLAMLHSSGVISSTGSPAMLLGGAQGVGGGGGGGDGTAGGGGGGGGAGGAGLVFAFRYLKCAGAAVGVIQSNGGAGGGGFAAAAGNRGGGGGGSGGGGGWVLGAVGQILDAGAANAVAADGGAGGDGGNGTGTGTGGDGGGGGAGGQVGVLNLYTGTWQSAIGSAATSGNAHSGTTKGTGAAGETCRVSL